MVYTEINVPITRVNMWCESCRCEMYSKPRWIFKPTEGESFHFCADCYNLIKTYFIPMTGSFDFIKIIKFNYWCAKTNQVATPSNVVSLINAYVAQLSTNYFEDVPVEEPVV